jgi:hypothetical protein
MLLRLAVLALAARAACAAYHYTQLAPLAHGTSTMPAAKGVFVTPDGKDAYVVVADSPTATSGNTELHHYRLSQTEAAVTYVGNYSISGSFPAFDWGDSSAWWEVHAYVDGHNSSQNIVGNDTYIFVATVDKRGQESSVATTSSVTPFLRDSDTGLLTQQTTATLTWPDDALLVSRPHFLFTANDGFVWLFSALDSSEYRYVLYAVGADGTLTQTAQKDVTGLFSDWDTCKPLMAAARHPTNTLGVNVILTTSSTTATSVSPMFVTFTRNAAGEVTQLATLSGSAPAEWTLFGVAHTFMYSPDGFLIVAGSKAVCVYSHLDATLQTPIADAYPFGCVSPTGTDGATTRMILGPNATSEAGGTLFTASMSSETTGSTFGLFELYLGRVGVGTMRRKTVYSEGLDFTGHFGVSSRYLILQTRTGIQPIFLEYYDPGTPLAVESAAPSTSVGHPYQYVGLPGLSNPNSTARAAKGVFVTPDGKDAYVVWAESPSALTGYTEIHHYRLSQTSAEVTYAGEYLMPGTFPAFDWSDSSYLTLSAYIDGHNSSQHIAGNDTYIFVATVDKRGQTSSVATTSFVTPFVRDPETGALTQKTTVWKDWNANDYVRSAPQILFAANDGFVWLFSAYTSSTLRYVLFGVGADGGLTQTATVDTSDVTDVGRIPIAATVHQTDPLKVVVMCGPNGDSASQFNPFFAIFTRDVNGAVSGQSNVLSPVSSVWNQYGFPHASTYSSGGDLVVAGASQVCAYAPGDLDADYAPDDTANVTSCVQIAGGYGSTPRLLVSGDGAHAFAVSRVGETTGAYSLYLVNWTSTGPDAYGGHLIVSPSGFAGHAARSDRFLVMQADGGVIYPMYYDNATQVPLLSSPASHSVHVYPITLTYLLGEPMSNVTLVLTNEASGLTWVYWLGGTGAEAGTTSFAFDPCDPQPTYDSVILTRLNESSTPYCGLQTYTVTLIVTDLYPYASQTAYVTNVTFAFTAIPPAVNMTNGNYSRPTSRNPLYINYTMGPAPCSQSVLIMDGASNLRYFEIAPAYGSEGYHSIGPIDPHDPTSGGFLLNGTLIPDDTYDVSIGCLTSYRASTGEFEWSTNSPPAEITIDTVSIAPTLTLPSEGSFTVQPTLTIAFTLHEPASAVYVAWLDASGQLFRWSLLNESLWSQGAHQVTINSSYPLSTSGGLADVDAPVPHNTYTLFVMASDFLANPFTNSTLQLADVDYDRVAFPMQIVYISPNLTGTVYDPGYTACNGIENALNLYATIPEIHVSGSVKFTFTLSNGTSFTLTAKESLIAEGASPKLVTVQIDKTQTTGLSFLENIGNWPQPFNYTVTAVYVDSVLNPSTPSNSFTYYYDTQTESNGFVAHSPRPISVQNRLNLTFDLPEVASNLSTSSHRLRLTINKGASPFMIRTFYAGPTSYSSVIDQRINAEWNAMPYAVPFVDESSFLPDDNYTFVLLYRDLYGNAAATLTVVGVVFDTVTNAPTLSLPLSGSHDPNLTVAFSLSEVASRTYVRVISMTDGALSALWNISSSVTSFSYEWDPRFAPNHTHIVSHTGDSLAVGRYNVSMCYSDYLSNPENCSAVAHDVYVDYVTDDPLLISPATGSTHTTTIALTYTLYERPYGDSVGLTFDSVVVLTLSPDDHRNVISGWPETFPTSYPHTFTLVLATSGVNMVSIRSGTFTVTLTMQDVLQNPHESSAATGVTIVSSYVEDVDDDGGGGSTNTTTVSGSSSIPAYMYAVVGVLSGLVAVMAGWMVYTRFVMLRYSHAKAADARAQARRETEEARALEEQETLIEKQDASVRDLLRRLNAAQPQVDYNL